MASGTVCFVADGRYQTEKTGDLKASVDSVILGGNRVVWVECDKRFRSFHPLTPVKEIRNRVDGLCAQGVLC
ncbi:MAG: hypothetical protein J0H02_15150 [Armatimonadetes bacterium]|nr:hypothetical protein [Armatimonadota bacterium]